MQIVREFAKSFVNLFYPAHCFVCSKPVEASSSSRVCENCLGAIKRNSMPPFELENAPAMAYSACLYEGPLKELIHKFKYNGKAALASTLSGLMLKYIDENSELSGVDLITVVPLHKKRLKEREFNQSLLLAAPIAKKYSLPLQNTLIKIRNTRCQNELLKSERMKNLSDAFEICPGSDIGEKNILLIDDVVTTGATLGECVKTLLAGGAKSATCLTLARGIM